MITNLTRRHFTLSAAAALAATHLPAQSLNIAEAEHDHVLSEADIALTAHPVSTADVSATVAALTAAFVITKETRYAFAAQAAIDAWLPPLVSSAPTSPSVIDLIPVAELARATSFLVDATPATNLTPIDLWLSDLLTWLTSARDPVIVRDTKDHRASAWLLLAAAVARSQRDEKTLLFCRHLFRKPTLRNQIDPTGRFPQELATPNPYRNTLFNFDLLCGACQLLDTPLDPLWTFELIDGISLRTVAAYLYPILADRNKWPGVSDADHFHDLPGRRPGLLFAGRAYHNREYVDLWRSTPPTTPATIITSFPIRQPLLWTTRAAHGL